MIDPVNEFDAHAGTRLLEFFDAKSPWYRRLWNVGLTLSLKEASEAIEALRAGALSEQSVGFLLNSARKWLAQTQAPGRQSSVGSSKRHCERNRDSTGSITVSSFTRSESYGRGI
jgi:hypothetical protein